MSLRPPEQRSSCFGDRIARITRARTYSMPTRCERWDCEHCRPYELTKRTQHLYGVGDVVLTRCSDVEVIGLQKYAAHLKEGSLTVTLPNQRDRLFITTPRVLPDDPVMDMYDALMKVLDVIMVTGIVRLHRNLYWQEQPLAEDQRIVPMGDRTQAEVTEILDNSGLLRIGASYVTGDRSLDDVRMAIIEAREELEGIDLEGLME